MQRFAKAYNLRVEAVRFPPPPPSIRVEKGHALEDVVFRVFLAGMTARDDAVLAEYAPVAVLMPKGLIDAVAEQLLAALGRHRSETSPNALLVLGIVVGHRARSFPWLVH